MDSNAKLLEWWRKSEMGGAVGAPNHAIDDLAQRYDLSLPADFERYLRQGVPIDGACDEELGFWWHLDRIKNIPDEYGDGQLPPFVTNGGRKYLFFLDHSIWCWAWAISCEYDSTFGKVALIGAGDGERFVAESFAQFVELYTTDWGSVV